MINTTGSAISAFTRLIGEPNNWIQSPDGTWRFCYDMAYMTRAILLFMMFFVIFGMLLAFVKSFGGRRR